MATVAGRGHTDEHAAGSRLDDRCAVGTEDDEDGYDRAGDAATV